MAELEPKRVAFSKTIMTELIMPNDTNPLGNMMGGNLMKLMDMAGGICAAKHCEAHVVTASVDNVSFKRPIPLGNVVTIEAQVTRAFNTSVEVFIEVTTSKMTETDFKKTNHAFMTFVALDEDTMRPISIPGVLPSSVKEKELFEGAGRRREVRLILAGRMKAEDSKAMRALFE